MSWLLEGQVDRSGLNQAGLDLSLSAGQASCLLAPTPREAVGTEVRDVGLETAGVKRCPTISEQGRNFIFHI